MTRPAAWQIAAPWIIVPTSIASMIAVFATAYSSDFRVGLVAGIALSLCAAFLIERRLKAIAKTIGEIAAGDRFASLPGGMGGVTNDIGSATESIRNALVEADAFAVDQRSREEEMRLRQSGRIFFTKRFQGSVNEVLNTFSLAGEEIRATATDLETRNKNMRDQIGAATSTAEAAAHDIGAVATAANEVLELIDRSGNQLLAARDATESTTKDLARVDQTVRGLSSAAERIGEVTKLIESIAAQTSLLALNATIESARAGEAGRGFAVVANEVKALAAQTAKAAGDIGNQIHGIQEAVDQTAAAITEVTKGVRASSESGRDIINMLEHQASELRQIGDRAGNVASKVSDALPDIGGTISQVEEAGEAVRSTAEHLLDRSEWLLKTVHGYFADLDHGAIKVGILHSLSGTMTAAERPLQQLLVMLIEELNESGGLLGRPVEAVIMNPRSDWKLYAEQTEAMLTEHKVAAIFGCWTSASRKQVMPILEREHGLLFYPSQYEGEEESSAIIYTGATPRQQALPAIDYLIGKGRNRFFLVGSDYVYPRTTNAIIRGYLAAKGIREVEERYAGAGFDAWEKLVQEIGSFGGKGHAAIISTLSGDANVPFYRELSNNEIAPAAIPVMSLSIGEAELPALASASMNGHLVAWNYLQSVDAPENAEFLARWQKFTNTKNPIVNDAMEATYIGFRLWCDAVTAARTTEPSTVLAALSGRTTRGLSGFTVKLDETNHHLHKPVLIGKIAERKIIPISASEELVPPEPWSPWLAKNQRTGAGSGAAPRAAAAAFGPASN
ncbi:MAG: transporter substrate-binding protein [Pseudorhodoplanes sp.]